MLLAVKAPFPRLRLPPMLPSPPLAGTAPVLAAVAYGNSIQLFSHSRPARGTATPHQPNSKFFLPQRSGYDLYTTTFKPTVRRSPACLVFHHGLSDHHARHSAGAAARNASRCVFR